MRRIKIHTLGKIGQFIILISTGLYAVGGTILYFFYSDDYTMLYFIQRNTYPGWPYDGIYATFYKPLYSIFGFHSIPYFALGVLTHGIAILSVYYFVRFITNRKDIAFLSSLIYATGYIGLEQYAMMMVSTINNLTIIAMLLILAAYVLWRRTKHWYYYGISFICYTGLFFIFPHRAYSLVLFLPTVALLYGNYTYSYARILRTILHFCLAMLPFVMMTKLSGVFSYGANKTFGIQTVLSFANPALIGEFFAIFGRMILPYQQLIRFEIVLSHNAYPAIGIACVIFVLGIGFIGITKQKNQLSKHLFFALLFTLEAYAGNFFLLPYFCTGGPTNRYMTISFVGFSALIPLVWVICGEVFRLQKKYLYKTIYTWIIIIYVLILATASHDFVSNWVKEQGIPAMKFVSQLTKYIKKIPQSTTILIDSSEYYPAIPRIGNILSNATYTPEVTFAVIYNVPKENITFTNSYDTFMDIYKKSRTKGGMFYSFYYNGITLHNTTIDLMKITGTHDKHMLLASPVIQKIKDKKNILVIPTNGISSFGDQYVELVMKVTPLPLNKFTYPFFMDNPSITDRNEITKYFNMNKADREQIFSYMNSRQNYYTAVSVTGTESHKDYPHNFMVDNRMDTLWLDAEHLWQLKPTYKLSFVVDLGSLKNVSTIFWVPVKERQASIYKVSASSDGVHWQQLSIKSETRSYEDSVIVSDSFDPLVTRYIRYEIDDTTNGQTPGIKELEVVESQFSGIDPVLAWRVGNLPFEYIQNERELVDVFSYLRSQGSMRILTKTNKEDVLNNTYFVKQPLYVDGEIHMYKIPIISRGTMLEKIGIEVDYPVEVIVEQVSVIREPLY